VIAAALAAYLFLTTPRQSAGVRFPLSDADRAMLAREPASAEAFALIPTAAALESKLRANPITRDAIRAFEEKQSLPKPWMLGNANLLVWRESGGAVRYFVQTDPLRSLFVRNAPLGEPIAAAELEAIVGLAAKLPNGDALVVQRARSRGAFPPIARPAVTSVTIQPATIELTSRAASSGTADGLRTRPTFPRGAILSAAFAEAPRLVDDLNRLFGTRVSPLLANGGAIAIYDIDARKLLPRPLGVIAIPESPERRAAFDELVARARQAEAVGVRVRTAEKDGNLLLSFDDSLDAYLKDVFEPSPWPAGQWALRADAQRLAPLLRKIGDSIGLRVASPRLFRSARDLERWIGGLEQASTIDALASDDGASETLKVRVAAK
jgi:hypothetical protein